MLVSEEVLGQIVLSVAVFGAVASHAPVPVSGAPTGSAPVWNGLPAGTTMNWAGAIYCPNGPAGAFCAHGEAQIQGVFGCWNLPHVARTLPESQAGGAQLASTWVGVAGTQGEDLVQIGTMEAPSSAPQAWWETLPSSAQPISLDLRTGDTVCAQVQYLGDNGDGQQYWYLSLEDLASGSSWNDSGNTELCGSFLWPACAPIDFSSAEWIVETPQLDGSTVALPAFSEVAFTNLEVFGAGHWTHLSQSSAQNNLRPLNIESGSRPTAPAYMTWSQVTLPNSGGSFVQIEYLAYLADVFGEVRAGQDWANASLLAEDMLTPHDGVAPFALAWVANCGGGCASAEQAPRLGFEVSTGNYLLGPFPVTGGADAQALVEACLWWAAPGSSNGSLAPGSLELECAANNGTWIESPNVGPTHATYNELNVQEVGMILALPAGLVVVDRRLRKARKARGRVGGPVRRSQVPGKHVRKAKVRP